MLIYISFYLMANKICAVFFRVRLHTQPEHDTNVQVFDLRCLVAVKSTDGGCAFKTNKKIHLFESLFKNLACKICLNVLRKIIEPFLQQVSCYVRIHGEMRAHDCILTNIVRVVSNLIGTVVHLLVSSTQSLCSKPVTNPRGIMYCFVYVPIKVQKSRLAAHQRLDLSSSFCGCGLPNSEPPDHGKSHHKLPFATVMVVNEGSMESP